MKVNKEAINEAIEETKEDIKDIQHGIEREVGLNNTRFGVQCWLERNRRWVDLGLMVLLYGTGNPAIATILAVLFIIDTM
tara:strand:- start:139 stop:378 length:240 start_codon:yes stop_codon:yes gene_type:complete